MKKNDEDTLQSLPLNVCDQTLMHVQKKNKRKKKTKEKETKQKKQSQIQEK